MSVRVFRDPVYGNISIPSPVIMALIDSPEVQRLKRIRQLGLTSFTFHGAEHSRFQHALGAMWIMHRILAGWKEQGIGDLTEEEVMACTVASLLHDVGHAPFSHTLERTLIPLDHERIGLEIVREVMAPLLTAHGVNPETVLAILEGRYRKPYLHELIASQMDVDRMDYLLRDSLYTGVQYGLFDIDRIIFTIILAEEAESGKSVLAIQEKGLYAAEQYVFARYFMYWQVYFHKTNRACEVVLRSLLRRASVVAAQQRHSLYLPENLQFLFTSPEGSQCATAEDPPQFTSLLRSRRFLEQYLLLDDFDLFHAIKLWQLQEHTGDAILSDLARRFINRRFFKAFRFDPETRLEMVERARKIVEAEGFSPEWYFSEDSASDVAYDYYTREKSQPIYILAGSPSRLTEISQATDTDAIKAISRNVTRRYLMVPHECQDKIRFLSEQKINKSAIITQ